MRLVPVTLSLVDAVLARPVLDEKGMVLVGSGVKLSERMVTRLKQLGVSSLYIEDKRTEDIVIVDAISDETRRSAVNTVYNSMLSMIETERGSRRASRPQIGRDLSRAFQDILADLKGNKSGLISLASIFTVDGYLYHHSVNVAILATALGLAKGYGQKEITELGIGALLHDIGCTRIPPEIMNKPGVYSDLEFEIVQKHCEHGYDILRTQDGISLHSAHIALQHHERMNGTGYPRKLKGLEISEYARIVAICDVYEALTSKRLHRDAHLPHEALEFIMGGGTTMFDLNLVRLFAKNVAIYPVGMTVRLNTNETAVVVSLNPEYAQRPIIRLLTDERGNRLDMPYDIDLTKELTMMIVSYSE
ncbi:HD-GYP domain-containing protein [Tumebacillus permanentifrigoris]|uniref:HD-GYP domain-containing protein (C-di-GMP phosphodiesterase class II) n=1 Tax=Tumebacillus permanentifrigoris TaxID=378543 RepID=A0A316D5M2_9BACL|nr:HD-GYP domain-containing protein [Tumebacillus permanentifrigoris]PWK08971.1 HD-GYP domain-containing protein (c-di-GMP phosphodiesterase class II) [Tumebacillus permanentifrigoris]